MATDYSKLKVTELKAELKRLGLPQNGLKADLVARLEDAAAEGDSAAGVLEADAATSEDQEDSGQDREDAVDEEDAPEAELQPEQAQPDLDPEPESAPAESTAADTAADTIAPGTDAPEAGAPSPQIIDTVPGESPPLAATTDFAAPSAQPSLSVPSSSGATPLRPAEVQQDSQKRKRRSASPPPNANDIAQKRARLDNAATDTTTLPSDPNGAQEISQRGEETDRPQSMDIDGDLPTESLTAAPALPDAPELATYDSKPASQDNEVRNTQDQPDIPMQGDGKQQTHTDDDTVMGGTFGDNDAEREPEHDVEPAIHPATSALYIKNFMRPLRPQAVKDHLLDLATPLGVAISDDSIEDFYLDLIRTHSFVVFNSVAAASRVRTALHNRVWPDETNRKALWVDFMPPERFHDWVDLEQPGGGGRGSSSRWEVVYAHDNDGNVVASLEESGAAPPAAKPPPPERKASIPTGPTGPTRGLVGVEGAPTGPRGFQAGGRPQVHASRPDRVAGESRLTRAYPSVAYQPVPDDLADKRLSTLRSNKSSAYDQGRDNNKEYQRYFFEHGSILVNRGPEIFLGIRPPHRERERRREQNQGRGRDRDRGRDREDNRRRGGGRGGGGGYRRMPMPHGVPKGGDRYRGAAATAGDHEDRSRGGDRYRGGSYDRY